MSEETTNEDVVLREDIGDISILRLNRPEYNPWGADMSDALAAHLHDISQDSKIGACILTGNGDRAFTSGVNVKDEKAHSTGTAEKTLQDLGSGTYPVFADLINFPKPLICAVNGYAIGAGFALALCCDIIFASDEASFRLPQVKLGIIPAYGCLARLALWVGRGRAFEIGIMGKKVSGPEGKEIGLVSEVFAASELLDATVSVAHTLAELPPLAFAVSKESLTMAFESAIVQPAAAADLYRSMALRHTSESAEAHAAWREKRPPIYR